MQREEIKDLKDMMEERRSESDELKVEMRRSKAIELDRIKDVKNTQKKLAICIKQSSGKRAIFADD